MAKKKFKDTGFGKLLLKKIPSALGIVGDLVPDRGVLGVVKNIIKKDDKISPAERLELEEAFQSFELEQERLSLENTKDARSQNIKIQDSANATKLAKNAAYYIDFAIVAATICLLFIICFVKMPEQNEKIAYMIFGTFLTLCGTVVNFHRGSSKSSHDKTQFLENQKTLNDGK